MSQGFFPNYNNQMYLQDLQNMRDRIDQQMRQIQQPIQQPPVQNIINTNSNSTVEIEARFLNDEEDVSNIIVKNKTLFIDEKNQTICLKELDGSISKVYQIIVPKDEKDLKIENLENQIKEMEIKFNEFTKSNQSIIDCEQSNAINNGDTKSTAKKSSK